MSSQTFYSYVCNTFLPCLKGKGIKLPILYLLDGHKSHLTYNLSNFCAQNGIFLYALFPNATHILQPADVSLFAPLKKNWKNIVRDWKKANNNKSVNKATFPILLETTVQHISADTIKNGFRKCGLYPFDVEAIDFTRCMQDPSRILGKNHEENEELKPTEFRVSHFLYFESVIPSKKRKEFRQAEMGEWVGDESSRELFEVWKKLKRRCQKNNKEDEINNTDKEEEVVAERNDNLEIYNMEEEVIIRDTDEEQVTVQNNNIEIYNMEEEMNNEDIGEELVTVRNNNKDQENFTEEINQKRVIIHSNVVIPRPVTQALSNNNTKEHRNQRISTSFLDHIFWPEESPEKKDKRITKERLPYATTSLRWLQYHENKENLKIQKEEAKREKAVLRKKKKEEKEKKANNNKLKRSIKGKKTLKQRDDSESEDDEEWVESGTSMDDISEEHLTSESENETLAQFSKREKPRGNDCSKGEFYVVRFPGKKKSHDYVCCVETIFSPNEIEVQALAAIDGDKSTYKIIEHDVSTVDSDQLLYKLEQPKIIGSGNRVRYKFSSEIN